MQLESRLCPSEGQLALLRLTHTERITETAWEWGRQSEERKQIKWQGSVAEFSSASVQGPPLPLTLTLAWQLKIHASVVYTTLRRTHNHTFTQAVHMQMGKAIQHNMCGEMHSKLIFPMHSELMAEPARLNSMNLQSMRRTNDSLKWKVVLSWLRGKC